MQTDLVPTAQLVHALDILYRNSPHYASVASIVVSPGDYLNSFDDATVSEQTLTYCANIVQQSLAEFALTASSLIAHDLLFDAMPAFNGRIQKSVFSMMVHWYLNKPNGEEASLLGQTSYMFRIKDARIELIDSQGSQYKQDE